MTDYCVELKMVSIIPVYVKASSEKDAYEKAVEKFYDGGIDLNASDEDIVGAEHIEKV